VRTRGRHCVKCVRRWGQSLSGRKQGECPSPGGTNGQFQPAGSALKNPRPEVQACREEPTGNRHRQVGDGRSCLDSACGRAVQRRPQVVGAVGWLTSVRKLSLTSEGRTLPRHAFAQAKPRGDQKRKMVLPVISAYKDRGSSFFRNRNLGDRVADPLESGQYAAKPSKRTSRPVMLVGKPWRLVIFAESARFRGWWSEPGQG
jgi:hypothetical protein